MIDDVEHELRPDSMFFINYNQVYNIRNCDSPGGKVLLFTRSFYNHVYTGNKLIKSDSALVNVPVYADVSGQEQEFANLFESIENEINNSKAFKKEIACLLLKVLMLKFIRSSKKRITISRSVDHKKEIVQDFIDSVNLHYKDIKTTSGYADKLNITANYLNILVKKRTGLTAGQIIKDRVILEAERLLLHSTISVREIAYKLGFTDNSHFGKYFKSVKGFSPNSYRDLNQK